MENITIEEYYADFLNFVSNIQNQNVITGTLLDNVFEKVYQKKILLVL